MGLRCPWLHETWGFYLSQSRLHMATQASVLRLIVVSHPQSTDTHGRPLCHLSMIYKVLSAPRLMYSFSVPRKPCIWISQHHILYLDHSNSTAKSSFANRAFFLSQHSVLILLADYYSYYLFPINFHGGRIFLSLLFTNMIVYWVWSKNTKLVFEFPFEFLLPISWSLITRW